MRNLKLILAIILLLPLLGLAQQRWYSTFGRPGEKETIMCVKESYDRGYLLSGEFWNEVGLVAKASINGDFLWDKVLVSDDLMVGIFAHIELSNGEKVLTGFAGPDPLIVDLNACGNKEWCYTYHNSEHFIGGYFFDVMINENGNYLALALMGSLDEKNLIYFFCFNPNGQLLWMKQYAKYENDPDLGYLYPWGGDIVDGEYFITGDCYYRTKQDPDLFALRPMFIKVDGQFNEEWFLPFGQNIDSTVILGSGFGVLEKNDSIYKGYGRYLMAGYGAGLLDFNEEGLETGYTGINRSQINDSITNNTATTIEKINDTLLMAAGFFNYSGWGIAMAEYIISTSGNVYGSQSHSSTEPTYHSMIKTDSSQFVFVGSIEQNDEWDIFLYKLNSDLSSAEPINDTITYDYLCDDLPIVSDTIDLSQCGIITGTGEIPTPEEYYASLETIPVKVHPNPAKDRIKMEIGKSGVYKGYRVRCYYTSGRIMYENTIVSETGQLDVDVSEWQSGIYVVVVTSDNGKQGSAKFVVE